MIAFLHDRLNSNYIPTPTELQALKRHLSISAQKLQEIDDKVDQLNRYLAQLNRQRDALDAKVTGYQGMFSPARRLLPDILQEIFIRCLPEKTNPAMSKLGAPLLLGRVCRQWRSLAYSTPALWSAIHIAIPSDSRYIQMHVCSHATRMQAIAEWLSRSGACPLDISIWTPYAFSSESQSSDCTIKCYFETLSPFITRCKSFHFSCNNESWDSFLAIYEGLYFPLLKYIRLDVRGLTWLGERVEKALRKNPLFASPQLSMISLVNCGPRTIQLPVHWEHLTVLYLCSVRWSWNWATAFLIEDMLLLLSWCRSLQYCRIPVSKDASTSHIIEFRPRKSEMVSLPNLIGLSIHCDCESGSLLAHLSTPSLRYLQYHQQPPRSSASQMDGEERALHTSLGPFVQRVIHPIEEFQFNVSFLAPSDLIQCLSFFPELKRLSLLGSWTMCDPASWGSINMTSISEWILQQFVRRARPADSDQGMANGCTTDLLEREESHNDRDFSASCLCPRLEVLKIGGASFSDELMFEFIRSRLLLYEQMGLARLRWLSIGFTSTRTENPTVREELDNLRKQSGAYLNVFYGSAGTMSLFSSSNRLTSPYNGLASVGSGGASFSDELMFEFIRSRLLLYEQMGLARMRWLSIDFTSTRTEDPTIREELDNLRNQSGAYLNVFYGSSGTMSLFSSSNRLTSPYNGLASVGSDGTPIYPFMPFFGSMLSRSY
ncbi:hypothetical protein AN958_00515 [Leucoagaricus sp. SymC.cos]|nr:hypothetical protein AN958_00515 [Leucoagaricus sp. SymC.cos]